MTFSFRRAQFALLASLTVAAASPALADVKQGVDAWSAGDYPRAVKEWQGPAQAGDPDAMFNLAQAYKLGRGVPRDLAQAETLYQRAAVKGHLGAADNYGLLLFQKGERAKAMPYLVAASDRGDPRAQYLLGLAYFNGDQVPRDWVRAYALVSLAQQAGLAQAKGALTQMDKHIPLADRQRSVPLAAELASRADQTRERQLAAADLGGVEANAPVSQVPAPTIASAEDAVAQAARVANGSSPAQAGADYTRTPQTATVRTPQPTRTGAVPKVASTIEKQPKTPATPATSAPAPVASKSPPPPTPTPTPTASKSGSWRVQLGAFGVAGNAEKLWQRVKARPELAGHDRLLVPAGRLTKLQAGGFASAADAQAACGRLKAGGFSCLPTRD